MNAEHVWLRTDEEGHLLEVPSLPPNSRIEAIFLVAGPQKTGAVRVPPPELASITHIHGDLVEPLGRSRGMGRIAMILLDTHAWIWWASRRTDLLPAAVDDFISNADDMIAVASVSCLEVAVLVRKGRIELSRSLDSWFEMAIEGCGLELLPLTPAIAARSASLPDVHRDPIDRALIATAMAHDAVLVTKDRDISSFAEIRTRWI